MKWNVFISNIVLLTEKTRKCYYSNEFSANTCNADDANNEAYKKINSDNSNDGNFLIKINR